MLQFAFICGIVQTDLEIKDKNNKKYKTEE